MSGGRRMALIEREAQRLLRERGYDALSVSEAFQECRYIPYNLIGRRARDGGGDEILIVKIKIALRPLSPGDAASFCRTEMVQVRKIYASLPPEFEGARYECWVSVPPDAFQQFAITGEGICEIPPAGLTGSPHEGDGGKPCAE